MDNIADVLKHIEFLANSSKYNTRKENRNFFVDANEKVF